MGLRLPIFQVNFLLIIFYFNNFLSLSFINIFICDIAIWFNLYNLSDCLIPSFINIEFVFSKFAKHINSQIPKNSIVFLFLIQFCITPFGFSVFLYLAISVKDIYSSLSTRAIFIACFFLLQAVLSKNLFLLYFKTICFSFLIYKNKAYDYNFHILYF